MSIAFINDTYLPLEDAKISPLDRGFLFGDGIYEVVPSYDGNLVGFKPHIDRMNDGLAAIGIQLNWSHQQWQDLCDNLNNKGIAGTGFCEFIIAVKQEGFTMTFFIAVLKVQYIS